MCGPAKRSVAVVVLNAVPSSFESTWKLFVLPTAGAAAATDGDTTTGDCDWMLQPNSRTSSCSRVRRVKSSCCCGASGVDCTLLPEGATICGRKSLATPEALAASAKSTRLVPSLDDA